MGFVYSFVSSPASASAAISSIANALVSAGWTLVHDTTTRKVLRCAPYTVGNSDMGSAVVELSVQGSYVQFGMHSDWNTNNNVGIPPSNTQRRLPYGYVSGWSFYIYANEYWFAVVPANSDGTYRTSDEFNGAGILVPPQGVTIPSPYKTIWTIGRYTTGGSTETINAFVFNSTTTSGNPHIIHPYFGREVRGNAVENVAGTYVGHSDSPEYLQDAVFAIAGNLVVGMLPYAYMTIARGKLLGTQQTIGSLVLIKIYLSSSTSGGSLWVRIQ